MADNLKEIILNLLSIFIDDTALENIRSKLTNKKFRIIFIVFILCIIFIVITYLYLSSITVTKVTISENVLYMNVNDSQTLTATVLYSNNSISDKVIWTSSNESVATIDKNGIVYALAKGTTIITAQASRNNTTETVECEITVQAPPSGYSISVQQTEIDSYAYIYVTPYEDDITNIQIYGKSPSGEIFTPNKDKENLYHFYSECGTWTIYASVENNASTYEANKPEDFVTIEVTNIFSTQSLTDDILDIFQ